MAQLDVRSAAGDVVEQVTLSDVVFARPPHRAAVYAAVQRQLANQRSGTAATKTRGLVSGGGRKPWRQKGTGRARQGSTRAPQWRHGGVVWGPHPRKYTQDLPRKVRRLALRAVLSDKVTQGKMIVVDDVSFDRPSTKQFKQFLQNVGVTGKVLVVLDQYHETVYLSGRNLPTVTMLPAQGLDVYNLLKADYLIVTRGAAAQLEALYG